MRRLAEDDSEIEDDSEDEDEDEKEELPGPDTETADPEIARQAESLRRRYHIHHNYRKILISICRIIR